MEIIKRLGSVQTDNTDRYELSLAMQVIYVWVTLVTFLPVKRAAIAFCSLSLSLWMVTFIKKSKQYKRAILAGLKHQKQERTRNDYSKIGTQKQKLDRPFQIWIKNYLVEGVALKCRENRKLSFFHQTGITGNNSLKTYGVPSLPIIPMTASKDKLHNSLHLGIFVGAFQAWKRSRSLPSSSRTT